MGQRCGISDCAREERKEREGREQSNETAARPTHGSEGAGKSLGGRESWWPRENTVKIIRSCHDRPGVTHPPTRAAGTVDGSRFSRLGR